MIQPIIMAGGSGSRLWPLSRSLYPKQFLSLTSNDTMLQDTISRLNDIEHIPPIIVCNEEHRFIAAEQLREKGFFHNGIILEPVSKNTAPAVALGAFKAISTGMDPVLLVLAADHSIEDISSFNLAIKNAITQASYGNLVTFGITPTTPETGYGYIKKGSVVGDSVYKVAKFVEKPNAVTAQNYLDSNDYLWNSGLFMFKASVFLNELKTFRPDIYSACEDAFINASNDLEFIRIAKDNFELCPSESVDYAVMEHTDKAVVVPLNAAWNDVGSWSALWDICPKDESNNGVRGDTLLINTSNSYISAQSRLVAAVGLHDVVVVETKDAVLVANKANVQDVKLIVSELAKNNRKEYLQNKQSYRPWGMHEEIAQGSRFHVKHVIVYPGQKISAQMHYHRAEHWIVVSGTAQVTTDEKYFLLTENESTFISPGVKHTLENPGKIPLEIIEIQSGSYLDEDDIIRVESNILSGK